MAFPSKGESTSSVAKGGADVFLDRPHFVGNKPKLILYCIGLMPPKDILIRSSLYQ